MPCHVTGLLLGLLPELIPDLHLELLPEEAREVEAREVEAREVEDQKVLVQEVRSQEVMPQEVEVVRAMSGYRISCQYRNNSCKESI